MQKYSKIASLLQKCLDSRNTPKSIILNSTQDISFIRQAFAIISKAIQHYDQLQKIVDEIQSIDYIDIHDHNLLIVLLLDIFNPLNKKAKRMGGQIARYLKSHQVLIKQLLQQSNIYEQQKKYIHLRALQPLPFDSEQDEHIFDLRKVDYDVYSNYLKLNPEYLRGNTYIVQSKSSALPAYLLLRNIKNKNADIIDCCAAPGNKTIQLSHYSIKNNVTGTIYAIERDSQRFQVLCNRLNKYQCNNVKPIEQDFLITDPQHYNSVKMALLDPSCSGSGMLQQRLIEQIQDDDNIEVPQQKLQQVIQLSQLQSKMLHHLTKFKNIRLIVYSTCSIYKQENEEVANQFLNNHKNWQAVNIFPEWPYRGIDNNEFVRVPPKDSDGFFVAMFKKVN